jgi:hypothetical protein
MLGTWFIKTEYLCVYKNIHTIVDLMKYWYLNLEHRLFFLRFPWVTEKYVGENPWFRLVI